MTARLESCAKCYFWDQEGSMTRNNVGACRRFPPATGHVVMPVQHAISRQVEMSRQHSQTVPITAESEWCGEFKPGLKLALN